LLVLGQALVPDGGNAGLVAALGHLRREVLDLPLGPADERRVEVACEQDAKSHRVAPRSHDGHSERWTVYFPVCHPERPSTSALGNIPPEGSHAALRRSERSLVARKLASLGMTDRKV